MSVDVWLQNRIADKVRDAIEPGPMLAQVCYRDHDLDEPDNLCVVSAEGDLRDPGFQLKIMAMARRAHRLGEGLSINPK